MLRCDRANFPNLKFPPFFADLKLDGSAHPELRIDGYVGNTRVLSRSFSSDHAADRLWLHADDAQLMDDGADSTRLAFAVVDKFGAARAFAGGEVALDLDGPGVIVGDNPFPLEANGGAGAVYIRTAQGRVGTIRVTARHATLGALSAEIRVRPQES
jgi:beta-galactosidase